jgi:hypothetical protein
MIQNHTEIIFGGNILASVKIFRHKDDKSKHLVTLTLEDNLEEYKVGEHLSPETIATGNTTVDFIFDNEESIDVVINQLQKAKEKLKDLHK